MKPQQQGKHDHQGTRPRRSDRHRRGSLAHQQGALASNC
jgi:hypothetical protein